MSYHDPYTDHYRQDSFGQHHYSDAAPNFNPYSGENNNYEGAAPYSSNTLNNEDGGYPPRQQADVRSAQGLRVEPVRRDGNGFEQGEFTPHPGKK